MADFDFTIDETSDDGLPPSQDFGTAVLLEGENYGAATDWLIYLNRPDPILRGIARHVDVRFEGLAEWVISLETAYDLETAIGLQQDVLGALLGIARNAEDDDRYRLFQRIQSLIILSSASSGPTILRIVSTFTEAPATEYANTGLSSYRVGADVELAADVEALTRFLREATAATYSFELVATPDGSLRWQLVGDADPTALTWGMVADDETDGVGRWVMTYG